MEPIQHLVKVLQNFIAQEGKRSIQDISYDIVGHVLGYTSEDPDHTFAKIYHEDDLVQKITDLAGNVEVSNGTEQQLAEMWAELKRLVRQLADEVAEGDHRMGKEGEQYDFWRFKVPQIISLIHEAQEAKLYESPDNTTEEGDDGVWVAAGIASEFNFADSYGWINEKDEPLLWKICEYSQRLAHPPQNPADWQALFNANGQLAEEYKKKHQ